VNTQERKERILAAAEEIFSKKGLLESSIAEIARYAGVADSVIYQYFKGKEDLIFSIPAQRMKEIISLLEEHLQGIQSAESQLSKMIWFHLNYNDTHRGYARLLLLECRSNKAFYQTEAYGLIRKYAGIMLRILHNGIEQGIFRDDVNMRLIRDIILGTLDFENLSSMAIGEIKESSPDLNNIMALILPMIKVGNDSPDKELDKGSRILLAAEKVFAEKGFPKATIAEIAKLAKVAEGTVYEYFKNKEDLLLSIPAKRFQHDINMLKETFEIKTPIRKLRRLIRYHFSMFLTERDFLKVFLLQIQLNARFYESGAYETFRPHFRLVENIIEEGKRDHSFRPDVNPRVFRNVLWGAFSHMALRWFILEKRGETDMMEEIDQITNLLSTAVLAKRYS